MYHYALLLILENFLDDKYEFVGNVALVPKLYPAPGALGPRPMSFYAATGSIPFQSSGGQQTDYTGQTGPSATNTYYAPVDLNGSVAVTPWAQYGDHTNGKLASNPEPAPVETPEVPRAIAHVAGASDIAGQQPQTVQPSAVSPVVSPARHSDGGKRLDLEQEVQALRKQLAQRHENDQRTLAQVSALTADLAAERQRGEDLGQQLHSLSTAHHTLQVRMQLTYTTITTLLVRSKLSQTVPSVPNRSAYCPRLSRPSPNAPHM